MTSYQIMKTKFALQRFTEVKEFKKELLSGIKTELELLPDLTLICRIPLER